LNRPLSTSTVSSPQDSEILTVGKRREADEIARLDEVLKQVIAKTDEYKKELLVKKKQLEDLNNSNASGAE